MFVEVVQGRTHDPSELRAATDRRYGELGATTRGWLGATAGVTDCGIFRSLTRFESLRSAYRRRHRRARERWWADTRALFTGAVASHDCTDIEIFGRGGSDEAGFVQIIEHRLRDREGLRYSWIEAEHQAMMELRPDTIGGIFCVHPDGGCTVVAYFTSEAAAREGESKDMPPEIMAWRDREMTYYEGEAAFYDLRDPWLYSP